MNTKQEPTSKDYLSANTQIPILNLYYLLCYAWNKLEEGRKIPVDASDFDSIVNLLSRVLVNGSNHLLKRGLDKSYREVTEEYNGIKGKLEMKASLSRSLFDRAKAICSFDEFSANNIQNQLRT